MVVLGELEEAHLPLSQRPARHQCGSVEGAVLLGLYDPLQEGIVLLGLLLPISRFPAYRLANT